MRTLYAKLAAGLFVLLVAIGIFYVFVSAEMMRLHFQTLNQQLNRQLARNIVADRNLVEEGRLNAGALKKTFQLYMSVNPSIEIYLLDLDGKIISYSADPKKIKRQHVALAPIRSFLAMDAPYPLLGDDPRSHDKQKAFSVTMVPTKNNPQGYLYVVLRGEQYDFADQMMGNKYFLRLSGWTVLAALVLGMIAGLIVFRLLTRRLTGLAKDMLAFEQSNFTAETAALRGAAGTAGKVSKVGAAGDEIDQLGLTFERMSSRIREQIVQLTKKDALRRELVAQAAHDLRTPLAAMLGYIESVQLKGDRLPAAERSQFLQIALRQGRRLAGLVAELFELAGLDARERKPDLEQFPISELVHDVLQKYQLRARDKEIALRVDAGSDLPFACGDIALTERVLDNLLDNAFAYTPAGGEISISCAVADRHDNGHKDGQQQDPGGSFLQVQVTIADSGPGIPQTDLPHLFEPFFRGKAKAFDTTHAGLGLAVAKRIMELQNGDVVAGNSPARGAQFVLKLPGMMARAK